ncbi:unnamed protein product [Ceratitis capitata]|uniref:(Mediterranean fruit fly) hypothetical protein n=1 Tax=Ceratitis capitata TaxID=7213 RepID=A0A811VFL8_CERCA|nr:unnamed protein product [Ceratitis capitata]
MGCNSVSSLLAFLELVVSLAALIVKKLTDSQGEQVNKRNQKLSAEWSLLNNLNWSQAGNDFSILTYGGYTFISGAFLLSRVITDKFERCEQILLYCGVIFFFTEACLVFGTLEYIPVDIEKNALVLGTLSAIGAILFFIDICYKSSSNHNVSKEVQTELGHTISQDFSDTPPKRYPHSKSVQMCPSVNGLYVPIEKYSKTNVLQTDV